jgi:methyltransferase family protein
METIRGRRSLDLDLNGLTDRLANYERIILDLGTGDGKFVHHLADSFPRHFVIGIDACRENLHEYSNVKLNNMLFIIANAQELPYELHGLISHITINFPWGSLLESLLAGDSKLIYGLANISRLNTTLDIRLNGGALSEAGTDLETGSAQIESVMRESGWQVKKPGIMQKSELQKYPTTWAKRLAFGRDPRAIHLQGCFMQ